MAWLIAAIADLHLCLRHDAAVSDMPSLLTVVALNRARMFPLALSAFLVNFVADGALARLQRLHLYHCLCVAGGAVSWVAGGALARLHLHHGRGLDMPTERGGG